MATLTPELKSKTQLLIAKQLDYYLQMIEEGPLTVQQFHAVIQFYRIVVEEKLIDKIAGYANYSTKELDDMRRRLLLGDGSSQPKDVSFKVVANGNGHNGNGLPAPEPQGESPAPGH